MKKIYPPREDSYLLQKQVKKYSKKCKLVLDIGTGTGIQGITAAQNSDYVLACDISKKAIEYVKQKVLKKKIKIRIKAPIVMHESAIL